MSEQDFVRIDEFLLGKNLDREYEEFLTHVNKHMGIPTDVPSVAKAIYFTIRYLEGHLNALGILSLLGRVSEDDKHKLFVIMHQYIDSIHKDISSL